MKTTLLILMAVVLAGCVIPDPPIHPHMIAAKTNNGKGGWLSAGMTKAQVMGVMGPAEKTEAYGTKTGGIMEFLFYRSEAFLSPTRLADEWTSICFIDGKLKGWGRNYYDDTIKIRKEIIRSSSGVASKVSGPISLEIKDVPQEPRSPKEGWCGEAAIQMALLHYGIYISQRHINMAGSPKHPDLYSNEMPIAMTNVGLTFERWGGVGVFPYVNWIRTHLKKGSPVLVGAKIYPTKHPEWGLDHFMLVAGCTQEGITFNTTWGKQVTVSDTDLASRKDGFSFKSNWNGNYGYAITGTSIKSPANSLPVRINIEKLEMKSIKLNVVIHGLERGKKYRLIKFNNLLSAAKLGANSSSKVNFQAESKTMMYKETVGIDDVRVWHCLPQ